MGRTPASYIPGMQNWITEARGSRGGIISRVKGMKQGREEGSLPDPVTPFTPRCIGTIADSPGSQQALCGTEVETKGERGKQVHLLILV